MRSTAFAVCLSLALALTDGCGSTSTQSAASPDSGVAAVDAPDAGPARGPGAPASGNGLDAESAAPPVDTPADAAGAVQPAPPQDGATFADAAGGLAASDAAHAEPIDASVVPVGPIIPEAGATGDAGEPPTSAFTCTLLIGILATEQWYVAGFETMVDSTRWELMWVHSGFVELWADPTNAVWSTAITSPCAQGSDKPDRVIFVALNFDFNTLAEWTPPVTASVANIQAKYPSAKRIELMSFIRAPGDVACPQAPAPRSTITPAQDQAMAMAAAANPGLVFVAPQFAAASCDQFSSNPPHPTDAGATAWATMMASYYR